MLAVLRFTGGLVLFGATAALGAPDEDGPLDRKVFPLTKEGDQWWAGVADVCELCGAKLEGEGFTIIQERDGPRLRIEARGVFAKAGPLRIHSGEDVYEFSLDQLPVQRNGEEFGDFVSPTKRIEGVVAATLEDLGRILGFEIGDEARGQPTLTWEGKQYRLVPGEAKGRVIFGLDGQPLRIPLDFRAVPAPDLPEGFRQFEAKPFIWKGAPPLKPGDPLRVPGAAGSGYEEHNGLLYQRGTVRLHFGPEGTPLNGGMETLYGPVVPGRYSAEGQSADLMYLSIVKRPERTGGMADLGGYWYRDRRSLEEK